LANPPGGTGDGASLVWTGGDYLYALRGEFLEDKPLCDFWRYSISKNEWVSLAEVPAKPHDGGVGGVGDGASLLYIGFWMPDQKDYIYALSGNQAYPETPSPIPDKRFYRYTISMNFWEQLPDLPFGVGDYVGCRLGYADGNIYAWQGAPESWEGGGDDLAKYVIPTEVHDLSIKVTVSPQNIYFGQNATLNITVTNNGTVKEQNPLIKICLDNLTSFNITLNGIIEPGKSLRRTILIPTIGLEGFKSIEPGTRIFTVEVYPVQGEVKVDNNVFSFNLSVLPDQLPPSIGQPFQSPSKDIVQQFQKVTVSVNVTDSESGVKNVTLLYQVNGGEWIAQPMLFNSYTGLYEAVIKGYPEETKIAYKILVYDNAGNVAQQNNAGEYFIYTIIPEVPLTNILLLFMILSVIAVISAGKKQY
jgi:uncharacterized repeat protein (TIGR01451 family)